MKHWVSKFGMGRIGRIFTCILYSLVFFFRTILLEVEIFFIKSCPNIFVYVPCSLRKHTYHISSFTFLYVCHHSTRTGKFTRAMYQVNKTRIELKEKYRKYSKKYIYSSVQSGQWCHYHLLLKLSRSDKDFPGKRPGFRRFTRVLYRKSLAFLFTISPTHA